MNVDGIKILHWRYINNIISIKTNVDIYGIQLRGIAKKSNNN